MQHPQILLHKRHLSKHLQKSLVHPLKRIPSVDHLSDFMQLT